MVVMVAITVAVDKRGFATAITENPQGKVILLVPLPLIAHAERKQARDRRRGKLDDVFR